MLSRACVVWNDNAFDAMSSFPLHRFESPPIAYLPIQSATLERFYVAIEANGTISCFSPRIETIHSVTRLFTEEMEEDVTVRGVSLHGSELCIVLWDAKAGEYSAHFLKAHESTVTRFGVAPLSPPHDAVFLCGIAHLGTVLTVVWSDGSLQCYTPRPHSPHGLDLGRTLRLTGFDFGLMTPGEAPSTNAIDYAVCSDLNVKGTLCVVGPQQGMSSQLKYMVIDIVSGWVQDTGIIEGEAGPIKMVPVLDRPGEFRLFIGKEDRGVRRLKMERSTLASRIGNKSGSRKRKLESDGEDEEALKGTVLQRPVWTEWISELDQSDTSRLDFSGKTANKNSQNLDSVSTTSESPKFDKRTQKCISELKEAMEKSELCDELCLETIEVLEEAKETGKVLLVDVRGYGADYMGRCCQNWSLLRHLLICYPPMSLNAAPSLPQTLIGFHKFDLFAELLARLREMRSDVLETVLQSVLRFEHSTQSTSMRCADQLDQMRKTINAVTSDAEAEEKISRTTYNQLKWSIQAVEGFSFTEVLLHSIVAIPIDKSELNPAMKHLEQHSVRFLLEYLHKWLKKMKDETVPIQSITGVECLSRIPTWDQLINWISSLLSTHAPMVIYDPSAIQTVIAMQDALKTVKAETKSLMAVHGLCKELLRSNRKTRIQRAEYQVEILDLTFDH